MNPNNKQDLSDAIHLLDGVNATAISLPAPSARRNSTGDTSRYAATWWDELVAWGKEHDDAVIGESSGRDADASELIGYHISVDGLAATLIVLSYSQGGFDGCVLVPEHLPDIDALVDGWLGDTSLEDYREGWEYGNAHAILDYTDIPDDWQTVED